MLWCPYFSCLGLFSRFWELPLYILLYCSVILDCNILLIAFDNQVFMHAACAPWCDAVSSVPLFMKETLKSVCHVCLGSWISFYVYLALSISLHLLFHSTFLSHSESPSMLLSLSLSLFSPCFLSPSLLLSLCVSPLPPVSVSLCLPYSLALSPSPLWSRETEGLPLISGLHLWGSQIPPWQQAT